jgi:hypothetical protein
MTTQYAATNQTEIPLAETVYAAQRGDRQAFGRLVEIMNSGLCHGL